MTIRYFHGQYKANTLGANEISNNICNLLHMGKVAAHFQKKNKCSYIHPGSRAIVGKY